ncbi:uncharacterized protein LOC128894242 [Hylaeus anthracinus]|uniref:uncharacterized protein LOC128894242 n=1 Tax=Hylaeus anthracinus TaxID=313031 RepID=UPI0023B9E51F|nr:uncharacterized protein LOC128894242 [Hylaeus anthracinus]
MVHGTSVTWRTSATTCYQVIRRPREQLNRVNDQFAEDSGRGKRGRFFATSVEGRNRSRKQHVTISPNKHQDVNDSGHVTKIEVELEEAPDDVVLIGSIPSELDVISEINSTYPDGIPPPGTVVVRAEEALIVILVLLLWAAAIALFFNRWGKIRMLEPYQPKFQQQHRPSCTTIEPNQLQTRRTYSKCNVLCGDELACVTGHARPRQNSVFIGSSASLLPASQRTPRRTKSAFDLQSLFIPETVPQDNSDPDASRNLKPASESTKLLPCDRRTSVCQSERNDAFKSSPRDRGMSICYYDAPQKSWHRDRGMSICQFDRTDVLARPLQRDRGGSICHFDRMDVLARPLQRDRTGSAYHFDRTDVLARPSLSTAKSLLRERRVSICNFSEKDELTTRSAQVVRRSSFCNIDKIEKDKSAMDQQEQQGVFAKCAQKEKKLASYHFDQPCCSKTSDVVFGYKATCV